MLLKENKLEEVFGLDLRSLGLFRIGLALVVIADLSIRAGELTAHYSDAGVLPRATLINEILPSGYWSINLISGSPLVQALLFGIALLVAVVLLVGYRTRLATIATWAMLVSIHNRNPALIFAADDVLRAMLFWSMFLPLGASYSLDSALNSSTKPLPKRVLSVATVAFIVQICYIYIFSAAFKTHSPLWSGGEAVYYSFQFDQYGTPLGQFLLNFPGLLKLFTFFALWLEWLGPLLLFIPFRTSLWRCVTIVLFVLLHVSFGLCFRLGIFPFLSTFSWLALIPSSVWDGLRARIADSRRSGLRIYYDAECGFCKKVVYLIRTFLILPGTPLLLAQSEPSIYADMQEKNSWVVVDWQEHRHYKWEAIAYVCSLSPLLWFLSPILRWKPLMAIGTKIYETIASNRRFMGKFTAPLKWKPLEVRPRLWFNLITFALLLYVTIWNFRSLALSILPRDHLVHQTFRRRTFNTLNWFGKVTRLDQSWSIFAPNPPRDDGWYVVRGILDNGREVDILSGESPNYDKPTLRQRNALYRNMQWRTYFINLNRAIGQKLYADYGAYLCRHWNSQHSEQLNTIEVYFMDETTVPPGETQTVTKRTTWEQTCPSSEE
ncbi:MAG: DCC1-like thiol-disulfide oxidoreductase family protein [Cyanophyceae cyanobacterium]